MTAADLVPREAAPWSAFDARRRSGQIPFQFCIGCERSVFYPRVLCPHCGSVELAWRESAGLGEVYAQTFVAGRDGGGYVVLLVDLAEGFRIMGGAVDNGDDLPIGTRVRGSVLTDPERPEGEPRFVFTREAAA